MYTGSSVKIIDANRGCVIKFLYILELNSYEFGESEWRRNSMKFKPLAIGVDNFEEMIKKEYYYVDKSLLIEQILESNAKVTLFTRPRRFGKSLNLSMLKYFFEMDYASQNLEEDLFHGLKIKDAGDEYLVHQGKYPVIMLNFKEMKRNNFQSAYFQAREGVGNEFKRHQRILELGVLDEEETVRYKKIQSKIDDIDLCMGSVTFLCQCLEKAYGEKAVILLDEYDVPLENAYFRGFYDEMIDFVRGMLSEAAKEQNKEIECIFEYQAVGLVERKGV